MSTAFSQQLAQLEDETNMSRIALHAGLSKRFKHIRESTSSLDLLHNLEDNLDVLFGNVVQALDKENDFLKVYIRDVLPADPGNMEPASISDHEHGTHSLSEQAEGIASGNSQFASSSSAQPMGSVQAESSEDPIVANNSKNDSASTPSNSTTSKQRQKLPKNPARFPCTDCGKRFTRSTTLREHMRSHSNERPFQCPLCGKKFARLKDRKRHDEIHLDEKQYICKGAGFPPDFGGCGRNFAREDGLFAHWRTESGWNCLTEKLESDEKAYKRVFEHIHRPLYDREGDHDFYCAEAIADVTPETGKMRTSRHNGCEKSYESARDLWHKHLSLEEGKDCLRVLLVSRALYLSKVWAGTAKADSDSSKNYERSEAGVEQSTTRNDEEPESELETSVSHVPDGDNLHDSEWRVLNCDFDLFQRTMHSYQYEMTVHLRAPFEMDPEDVSFHIGLNCSSKEIHDGTWTKDLREYTFTWKPLWNDMPDTTGVILLEINPRQKEALINLGMLTVRSNRLFEFVPRNITPKDSKNLKPHAVPTEDPRVEKWRVLSCEFDTQLETIYIYLEALFDVHGISPVIMLNGELRLAFTFRIVFGAFEDGHSQECSLRLLQTQKKFTLACKLGGFLLADSTSNPALPCYLKIQYKGETALLPLGRMSCRDGYLVEFNPFCNIVASSRLINPVGQPF